MLLGEQRRRHQHRDLLAVGHRDERRAQRDFGLAEADVAADQPVHGLAPLQVFEDGVDRGGLVRRFLEREAFAERFVVVLLHLESMALAQDPLRVEVEQLRGRVAHLRGGLLARFFPLPAAELVQRRGFRRRAAVARDEMQARDGHVELVAAARTRASGTRLRLRRDSW